MSKIGSSQLPTFTDTSAHYAVVDEDDINHVNAVEFLHKAKKEGQVLFTSNFVLAGSYGLILLRLGRDAAYDYVGRILSGDMSVVQVTSRDEKRAWEILTQYDDQDFSYVDATSFALTERLGILEAFAFDKHFDVFKTKHGQRLTRLPCKRLK